MPALIFCSASDAHRLNRSTGCPVWTHTTPVLERIELVKEFNTGNVTLMACTPVAAYGWRAPKGTQIFFLDSFVGSDELRRQAEMRVPL